MNPTEVNKLVELAEDKRVLYICNTSEFHDLKPASTAKTLDVVMKDGRIWDMDNVRYHIGRAEQLVPMFLPNFDMVYINGDNRFAVGDYDLGLAYDKVGYGGTIAYYSNVDLARKTIEAFMAATHKVGKTYLPYHLHEVDNLYWFIVDWDQHTKVADTNMPATM